MEPALVDPESIPTTLPLISSISLRARAGVAIISNTAGEVETWDISTSDCRVPSQALAKHYKHEDTRLINSKLIFVWYVGEEVSVWDTGKEEFSLQVKMPEDGIVDLRISRDGSKLFCIHCEFIQAWDMWTGETLGRVGYKVSNRVELLAMDGSRVWLQSGQQSKGWDIGASGLSPIGKFTGPPKKLHLSSTKQWDTGQCGILDIVTGKVVFQLPPQFGTPIDIKWNSQYLVASFQSRMELILEFHPAFL